MPVELQTAIESVSHAPFTAAELSRGAAGMKSKKSTGLARIPIEYLRHHEDGDLWEALATLFNYFIRSGYPGVLNHMLMLPLFKNGDV